MSSNDHIRPAVMEDLEAVMALYAACTQKMNAAGLFNWHSRYPNIEILTEDIRNQLLYVLVGEGIIGAVTLNSEQPPEYADIEWEHETGPFMVVHRLAVHPLLQGTGRAVSMMQFAEESARKNGFSAMRMDVYSINTPGRNLYRKLNYRELNLFHFPGFDIPFVGLEKKLANG